MLVEHRDTYFRNGKFFSLSIFFLPIVLFGSMLSDAESLGQKYALEIAKKTPPIYAPQEQRLLDISSVWLSIDLNRLPQQNAIDSLNQDPFWDIVENLGIDGLHLKGLKEGGFYRTGLSIDSKWGDGWPKFTMAAKKRAVSLIGDLIGPATGKGKDFELALQHVANYTDLYHLIEIDPADWNLLPQMIVGSSFANIPWLNLEALYKKGYIPERAHPYIKESAWNATGKIACMDGRLRRWIYLKTNKDDPLLFWLSPSLASERLLTGDILHSVYTLAQKVVCIDAALPDHTKTTASLWTRKIGGFTVQKNGNTLQALKNFSGDLTFDTLTRPALLHALITEDTEALRLIYKLYLNEEIASKRQVHALEPFDAFACDWTEFLTNPKKSYLYREEEITGEILRKRLLTEDLMRLQGIGRDSLPLSTWGGYCQIASKIANPKDFEKQQEELQKAHLLCAFTYAMQPGVFSFSVQDLTGILPQGAEQIDLLGPNKGALYSSIPSQLQTPRSFASRLKYLLTVRKKSRIAMGEMVAVPPVSSPGSFLLLHRLPQSRFLHLLAVNFSRKTIREKVEVPEIQGTWAIDLMSDQSIDKVFDSGCFTFELLPLSGKVFLFQPKYFD